MQRYLGLFAALGLTYSASLAQSDADNSPVFEIMSVGGDIAEVQDIHFTYSEMRQPGGLFGPVKPKERVTRRESGFRARKGNIEMVVNPLKVRRIEKIFDDGKGWALRVEFRDGDTVLLDGLSRSYTIEGHVNIAGQQSRFQMPLSGRGSSSFLKLLRASDRHALSVEHTADSSGSTVTPTGDTVLHSILRSAGLGDEEIAIAAPLIEPLIADNFFYELADTANTAAIARGLDSATKAAKENPTDDNLRAFGEAYQAASEIQKYKKFIVAVSKLMPSDRFDALLMAEKTPPTPSSTSEGENSGIQTEPIVQSTIGDLGLYEGTRGVLVTGVTPTSRWASAGIATGMIIESVQFRVVASTEEFAKYIGRITENDQPTIGLWYRRNGEWQRKLVVVPRR